MSGESSAPDSILECLILLGDVFSLLRLGRDLVGDTGGDLWISAASSAKSDVNVGLTGEGESGSRFRVADGARLVVVVVSMAVGVCGREAMVTVRVVAMFGILWYKSRETWAGGLV